MYMDDLERFVSTPMMDDLKKKYLQDPLWPNDLFVSEKRHESYHFSKYRNLNITLRTSSPLVSTI